MESKDLKPGDVIIKETVMQHGPTKKLAYVVMSVETRNYSRGPEAWCTVSHTNKDYIGGRKGLFGFHEKDDVEVLRWDQSKVITPAEEVLYQEAEVIENIQFLKKLAKYGYKGIDKHTELELADFEWRFSV